jgi:hypothetical protein
MVDEPNRIIGERRGVPWARVPAGAENQGRKGTMDSHRFDELTRALTNALSRRGLMVGAGGALGGLLGQANPFDAAAACKGLRKCGKHCCRKGQFCCDAKKKLCCSKKDECCNVDEPEAICCSRPRRCGKPFGNENAPWECCPPRRQWFTHTGRVRCCPDGTRSLGTDISSDDGPCCPEEKYCSEEPTGGKCCPDVAPVCIDRRSGQCCTDEARCGKNCCSGAFSDCCNDQCRFSDSGPWTACADGKSCCPAGQTCCDGGPVCCDLTTHICVPNCVGGAAACCPIGNPDCCDNDCGPTGCGG